MCYVKQIVGQIVMLPGQDLRAWKASRAVSVSLQSTENTQGLTNTLPKEMEKLNNQASTFRSQCNVSSFSLYRSKLIKFTNEACLDFEQKFSQDTITDTIKEDGDLNKSDIFQFPLSNIKIINVCYKNIKLCF